MAHHFVYEHYLVPTMVRASCSSPSSPIPPTPPPPTPPAPPDPPVPPVLLQATPKSAIFRLP